MNKLGCLIIWIIIIAIIYFPIAGITWQIRNPKANRMTFFTYFTHVVSFEKLETFQ